MNPECLLLTAAPVNTDTLAAACQKVLGYSPLRATAVVTRQLSETERFVSCLAAIRDRKAPVGFAANLLGHVMFNVFIVADDRDMLPILEHCAGMVFVIAETTVSGVLAAVLSGTLSQWRDAVIGACSREVGTAVRLAFNKIQAQFKRAGVNVWDDYRARDAGDHTLLLEYKPQSPAR